MRTTPTRLSLATCLLLPFVVSSLGRLFAGPVPSTWYEQLLQPIWSPPSWVFGPVWTLLYLLMGVSCFLLWSARKQNARTQALTWYGVQLALNASWTPVFFGLHAIGIALVILLLLDVSVLVTIWCTSRVSRTAAYLLLPYLAWILFATLLNAQLWLLNGS